MMSVKEFLALNKREVIKVQSDATVYDAIDILVKNRIGALPALDENGVMEGIITERDILKICAQHREGISRIKINDVMTKDVIIGVPDDNIEYVMTVMTEKKVRHLPVMDGFELFGMISARDIVESQLLESRAEIRHLNDYLHLLKAILQNDESEAEGKK